MRTPGSTTEQQIEHQIFLQKNLARKRGVGKDCPGASAVTKRGKRKSSLIHLYQSGDREKMVLLLSLA